MAHMLLGSTLIFGFAYMRGLDSLYIVLPIYVVISALKEGWYDEIYEDTATRGSSLLDFTMYQVGAWVAFGLVLMHANGLI